MWSFGPEGKGALAYRRLNAPSDAKGELAVYGCGEERYPAVMRWPIARFNPAYIVAPPQFPKWQATVQAAHNSNWSGLSD